MMVGAASKITDSRIRAVVGPNYILRAILMMMTMGDKTLLFFNDGRKISSY